MPPALAWLEEHGEKGHLMHWNWWWTPVHFPGGGDSESMVFDNALVGRRGILAGAAGTSQKVWFSTTRLLVVGGQQHIATII